MFPKPRCPAPLRRFHFGPQNPEQTPSTAQAVASQPLSKVAETFCSHRNHKKRLGHWGQVGGTEWGSSNSIINDLKGCGMNFGRA